MISSVVLILSCIFECLEFPLQLSVDFGIREQSSSFANSSLASCRGEFLRTIDCHLS